MKYYFSCTECLQENIEFDKVGIKFRNITNEEKNELMNFFFNDVLNRTKIAKMRYFNNIIRNNNYDFNIRKDREKFKKYTKWFDALSKNEQDLFLMLSSIDENSKSYSKSVINKKISKLKVIEIDKNKFCKFFPESYAYYFLTRLTQFTVFLESEEMFAKNIIDNKYMIRSSDIIIENPIVIINFFFRGFYELNLNFNFLSKIAELLNSKSQYYCFHFVSIIDALFENQSIENEIINKVSLIERLIVHEGENIEKQFILKVGTIIKVGKYKNIKEPEKILKSIYKVRSYLVHGNEKKLFEQLKEIGETVGTTELNKNKFENKQEVLVNIKLFLDIFLKEILVSYISNNEFCEFLKNN